MTRQTWEEGDLAWWTRPGREPLKVVVYFAGMEQSGCGTDVYEEDAVRFVYIEPSGRHSLNVLSFEEAETQLKPRARESK